MLGLMQDWPLLTHRVIDYAALQHPDRAVISRSVEGPIRRTTYHDVRLRALKLAQRLALTLEAPCVLDADALTAFRGQALLLRGALGPRILTPHPAEATYLEWPGQ